MKSRPGRGSSFIVAFPVRVSEEVSAIANLGGEDVPPGVDALQGKTYLLLDDVSENTFIVAESLKRYGILSVSAQSGAHALEIFKDRPETFAGIITDLRMPAMSGQSFVQEIRKFERESLRRSVNRPVPILIMTAEAAAEEKRLCLTQYGANEFLLKPVKLRDFLAALVRVSTEGSRAQQRGSRRVLIVDDDAMGAKFMTVTLTNGGHRCSHAVSMKEGLELLQREETGYDVIILDNFLGDGTGLEFLKLAGNMLEAGGRRAKVVSISGNDVEEQKRMYEVAGKCKIDAYLQKPVKKQEVLGLIQII